MNTEDKIKKRIQNVLPKRQDLTATGLNAQMQGQSTQQGRAAQAQNTANAQRSAKELAQLKYKERTRMRQAEAMEDEAKRCQAEEHIETIEAIAEQNSRSSLDVAELAKVTPASEYPQMVKKALQLQGTSRPEIVKLLNSLNINLSVQLSKQDTANLLACLLTCNESQLQALLKNPKVPVVIKTVIKRMMEDMKLGNIDTVERLWTRLFGKGPMTMDLPEQAQVQTGILPNTPLSREAYIIIRETLIGQ